MKKVLSVVCSVLMIASAFVGCSKQANTQKNTENNFKTAYVYDSSNKFDESAVRAYEKVCAAIENGDTSVSYNKALEDDVNLMLHTNYPLINTVKSVSYDEKSSSYIIDYNDAESQKTTISDFNKQVETILEKCGYNKNLNSTMFLLNVYKYFATNATNSTDSTSTVYDVIMNGEGMPATINSAFEYVLLQADYKCIHITGTDNNGAFTAWSAVQIGNEYYFFDPAKEGTSFNEGAGLAYFGETTADRAIDGYKEPYALVNGNEVPKCNSKTYKDLRTCQSWQAKGDSSITITLTNGKNSTFNLNK